MIRLILLWQEDTFSFQCHPFSLHSLMSEMKAAHHHTVLSITVPKGGGVGGVVITSNNRSIIVKRTRCHFKQLHVRISNAARHIITLSERLIDTFKDSADSGVLEVAITNQHSKWTFDGASLNRNGDLRAHRLGDEKAADTACCIAGRERWDPTLMEESVPRHLKQLSVEPFTNHR